VISIQLQPITEAFLPAVLDLDRLCFNGLWTPEGYQREIDSPNSELIAIVTPNSELRTPNSLLGYACFWAILDEAHITIVAVHPNHRRKGLGHLLLYSLLVRACQRGMERATLEVRISNQSAIALYQTYGFKIAGQRKRYYTDTDEDALILWRSGLQSSEFASALKTWEIEIENRIQQHWILMNFSEFLSIETSSLTY
jgi:[ribosomal protein S18]-alanine N-acetyltransferase